jgi:hypothetical protein
MTRENVAIGTRVVRSLTPETGALIGGLGAAVPIIAAAVAEMLWGRPSSTSGLAFPAALVLGVIGAFVGAALGLAAHYAVIGSRWEGPVDWRVGGALLLIVISVPTVWMVGAVLRQEALNRPRVIVSTGTIVRMPDGSSLQPVTPATVLWSLPEGAVAEQTLMWNGEPVAATVSGDRLIVRAGTIALDPVSLRDFDYARDIRGVTAVLRSDGAEYLALLVGLRSTGSRSLLLIVDPDGAVVHLELLERRGPSQRSMMLSTAGPPGRQEIVVDVMTPVRYAAAQP